MGGSPHLNERQHVPQAQSQLGSQYPVAAARENGRAASSHDFYNTVERNIIPATHHPVSPLDARTETEPANSSHKNHSETTSSASSIVLVPQSQELDSSNCTTAQRGSLLQPPMQPESTGASNLGKIDEKTVALNPDTQNDTPGSESPSKLLLGQKRTATGVVKPAANPQDPHYLDQNGTERRRSRSIGSVSRGSRIAALSVHLRTRLSYAAAKIEKNRQSHNAQNQLPLELLHSGALSQISSVDSLRRIGLCPSPDDAQAMDINSPDGTTVSAPDFQFIKDPLRASPIVRSDASTPLALQGERLKSHSSTAAAPKLAPPADIISSNSTRRRRPNPNETLQQPRHSHFPLHRRHHSQQESSVSRPAINSGTVLVPGTPPLRPSSHTTSTPYDAVSSRHGQSQNSSMEQDAIETLLFMSSPGNSGYHSNSQSSQPQKSLIHSSISNSIDSISSSKWCQAPCIKDELEPSDSQERSSRLGLEAQAGDEIDRILDQMDSDSDDEKQFTSNLSNRLNTSSMSNDSSARQGESSTS